MIIEKKLKVKNATLNSINLLLTKLYTYSHTPKHYKKT